MSSLRSWCVDARISAVDRRDGGRLPAPPGVDVVYPADDPGSPGFVASLLDAMRAAGADTLLPWTDRDALGIAAGWQSLREAGLHVVAPPPDLVALACDKWDTSLRLAGLGLSVPAACLVRSGRELASAAEALGYPHFGLVVKPRSSSSGQGVWVVRADADPRRTTPLPHVPLAAMCELLDQRPAETPSASFFAQREVAGADISVDVLADRGVVLSAIARLREATLGGLSVQGCAMPLSSALQDVVNTLVRGLNWSSLVNVQFIVGADRPVVYEINARVSGSIGISAHTGSDLLIAAIQLARDEPVSELTTPTRIRFRRYWTDQFWTTGDGDTRCR